KRYSGLDLRGRGSLNTTIVKMASAIEPEWLLDLFPDDLREETEINWNVKSERIEIVNRFYYDCLVIDEKRMDEKSGRNNLSDEDEERITRTLAEAALSSGLQKFIEPEIIDRLIARIEFLRSVVKDETLPLPGEDDVRDALFELCKGKRSFAELRSAINRGELIDLLREHLSPAQNSMLERLAPESISLPARRRIQVNYGKGKSPWIESRLQDFFGLSKGPAIANGRVPLVLHLLAPNQRPVQVTTDLAGFWIRHYPQIRRELSRRYPRHAWPENPLVKG
ncbi:MAG TPA: ATP-dependent helicase C-terminal domain-containing protein, partial [Blastocatellia bacterium]|nr:ATP-dependent helicase C-terminal domain-containing protein [Blastocatellia bacterium]